MTSAWDQGFDHLPPYRGSGADAPSVFWPQQHAQLLQRAPERYSEMVSSISAFGIHLIDRRGIIRSWNHGAEKITGLQRDQAVGRPFEQLFPTAAIAEGIPRRTLEFVRAHQRCSDEQRRVRGDGTEFIAQTTLDLVRSESGELLGFVEVFQDVTEARQREQQLYQRATRDPLTGVSSRGHLLELADNELERARRFSEPLSVLLLDIDHLKRINDTYGQEVGDRTLIAVTKACVDNSRKIDSVGRIGGEEFAVVLPRANKQPATEMAQRLRRAIGEIRVPTSGGREIGVTVSIGVAAMRPTTRDFAELLRQADVALYQAKREGRNRVQVWFE
ncbi:diguanylate cyclase [Sinimarinibacterium sp. CAU 1509]|uniref:GGDEF domain-containing protein n=1 Tax=Sinimarinibacterium sp. CAU 1509 TaxID=2562283 RepID=UPI0010AB5E2A|nr:sensor domain-containing diguanylate cyclase [Sinimarinibacterium sp. CAU 1509]TJY58793.1 diguanylate cyclase [Sinimarinibacterium sp. CAU 1509]